MGALDSVFGGAKGVSALLHQLLGGTATVRVVSGQSRDNAGNVTYQETLYPVAFVPAEKNDLKRPESAPGAGRSDVRLPDNEIAGSFPCSDVPVTIIPERDSILIEEVPYTITSVSTLKVGQSDVQYSIRARRC